MLEAWTNRDTEQYTYLVQWFAHLVQNSNTPVGTALVLRGEEGCTANIFKSWLGPHFKHLTTNDELTAEFNEWLEDALLVFADESVWGQQQVMKSFRETVKHVNHTHLILSSNNKWIVPVGSSNRRWVVLDVNPKYMGLFETKVFRETLICYLDKHVDLIDFVAHDGCVKSLLPSLDPIHAWLYNVLSNGHLDPFLGELEVDRSNIVYQILSLWVLYELVSCSAKTNPK